MKEYEFKVGDRVIVNRECFVARLGDIGTVHAIDDTMHIFPYIVYIVNCDRNVGTSRNRCKDIPKGHEIWLHAHDIELYDKSNLVLEWKNSEILSGKEKTMAYTIEDCGINICEF